MTVLLIEIGFFLNSDIFRITSKRFDGYFIDLNGKIYYFLILISEMQ
jgi:hypothetical protein